LLQHSALGIPMSWHLCLVSSTTSRAPALPCSGDHPSAPPATPSDSQRASVIPCSGIHSSAPSAPPLASQSVGLYFLLQWGDFLVDRMKPARARWADGLDLVCTPREYSLCLFSKRTRGHSCFFHGLETRHDQQSRSRQQVQTEGNGSTDHEAYLMACTICIAIVTPQLL
jgi:hypothetical protein